MTRPDRYSRAAAAMHWTAALLILGTLATGYAAGAAPAADGKAGWLALHLPLGLASLAVTLARLVLALVERRRGLRPAPLPMPAWQRAVSSGVHGLLVIIPLGMAASGIGLMALSGAGPLVFAGAPMPDFFAYAPRLPHGIGARLLTLLLVLHVLGGLSHGVRSPNGALRRMWPAAAPGHTAN